MQGGLTKRQREVLTYLTTDEGDSDLVTEGLDAFFGIERTSRQLVRRLVELCAIGVSSGSAQGFENERGATYWHINELGRWFLVDEKRAFGYVRRVRQGKSVNIPTAPRPTSDARR